MTGTSGESTTTIAARLSGFSREAESRFLATEKQIRQRLERFCRAEARRDHRAEVVLVKHVQTAAKLVGFPRRGGVDFLLVAANLLVSVGCGVVGNMIFSMAFSWATCISAAILFGLASLLYAVRYGPR